jgi:CheY-like chemotaxis protein
MSDPRPLPVTRLTVIVAEDEDVARRLVSRLLEAEGYRILEARDGGEALRLAREAGPHLRLVVTDVVMPGMDGWELGRRLAVECPGVQVLYLSAYPQSDIFNRGAPSEKLPFLEKPFSSELFLKTVRGMLEAAPDGAVS